MLSNCGFRLPNSICLRKSEKWWAEVNFWCTKRLFLSNSAWISANFVRKLSRKLRMSTSSFTYSRKNEKCWEKAYFSMHKATVFERFCLNLCKFCKKNVKKIANVDFIIQYVCTKAKNVEIKHILHFTKLPFLSNPASISAYLREKCEKNVYVNQQ